VKAQQGDQMIRKTICQIFQRIAHKVAKSRKGQNIYNKAQFGSPKHPHQTTFETLKYLQQTMF
jgi:hypothetical protein